ncbi:MAG: DUF998 domain-containing protein [Sulfolobales archaeon]
MPRIFLGFVMEHGHSLNPSYLYIAGVLIFLGCSQFLIAMIIASSLYPGYSISGNYISDLGATCRGGLCVVHQPSSIIFNSSSIILGAFLIAGSLFIRRGGMDRLFQTMILITGIGSLGVGLFPESYGVLHTVSASIAFIFGASTAIAGYRVLRGYARFIASAMGVLALVFLALFITGNHLGLGPGGVERVLAYLELLFGIMVGGYLMGFNRSME